MTHISHPQRTTAPPAPPPISIAGSSASPMKPIIALAPIVVIANSGGSENTLGIARMFDLSRAERAAFFALEQHLPSIACVQLPGGIPGGIDREIGYSCSHSITPELLRRVQISRATCDVVYLMVGGEAEPTDVAELLRGAGLSAECKAILKDGKLGPLPTLASKSPENHLHLTSLDLPLFDSVTFEGVRALLTPYLKAAPETRVVMQVEGLIQGHPLSCRDGNLVLNQEGTLKSPYGSDSFLRLFGKGILNPAIFSEVGLPLLPNALLKGMPGVYPDPSEEFKLLGKIRPSLWELDRWFLALEARCLSLTKSELTRLSQPSLTIGGKQAMQEFSEHWFAVLSGYVSYRIAVFDFMTKDSAARTHALAPEWMVRTAVSLQTLRLKHSSFLKKLVRIEEGLLSRKLGAAIVENLPRLAAWPKGLPPEPQVLESLLQLASIDGATSASTALSRRQLSGWFPTIAAKV